MVLFVRSFESRTLYKAQGSQGSNTPQKTFTDLEIGHYIVMIVGAAYSKTSPSSCIPVHQGVEVVDWWTAYVGGGNYQTACAIFKVTNTTVTLKGDYVFLIEYI
jgi:hypothetical protein